MGTQTLTRPQAPRTASSGYQVLVFTRPGDTGRLVDSFSILDEAMESAGARWYEAAGDRPYDVWVRAGDTGRLHFAPGLRTRLEARGDGDPDAARCSELLERAPLP